MDSLKNLKDKRAMFVEQNKKLLDKCIAESRGLNESERAEHERLAGEVRKMDDLLRLAESIQGDGGRGGTDVNLRSNIGAFGGQLELGQRADFLRTGYTTEHRDIAEFIRDVRYPTQRKVMSMDVGATGGFMVPEQLLQNVLMIDPEVAVITARATTVPPFEGAPDAATEIPSLDQSGTKGILGGVELSWIAEGAEKQETEPALRQLRLEPKEIAGYVVVTDKMIRNAGAEFDTFLRRTLSNALASAQEQAFINGTGVGQPLGIIGHPATIAVARAGAGAIAYQDLVDMIAVFGPNTWAKGVWLASQSALPELLTMADPGAGGTLVLKPADLRLGTPPNLLGIPLVVTTRTPVLGATGDLMLIEPSYYLRKLGSGPFIQASEHPRFTKNQTIVKIFANVDGQPWLSSPVLMEDGVTELSPFVVLAA